MNLNSRCFSKKLGGGDEVWAYLASSLNYRFDSLLMMNPQIPGLLIVCRNARPTA